MNFKKLLNIFSMLVMVMGFNCAFTSCSDDDEPEQPKEEERVPTSAMCSYRFECSQDMLDVLDITIQYVEKGNIVSAPITQLETKIQVANLTLPATFGYRVSAKVKAGVSLTKASYNFKFKHCDPFVSVYDQNGKKIDGLDSTFSSMSGGTDAATPDYITGKYGEGRVLTTNGITVDKQGNYSSATINWD